MDQTLVIVKPDGVQRGLVGQVLGKLEARGLKLVALKMIKIDMELAGKHYGIHRGKPFFEGLVAFITSSPVVVAVFEGKSAVEVVRNTMGATNPVTANPGTVRGDFALEIGRNIIHGSDSLENARKEIDIFFRPEEIISWERQIDRWVSE